MELVWIGAAFVLGLLANAAGLPPLLGYLVAGFGLGAAGADGGHLLAPLAHYGVIFLLFALGLRIRMRNMIRLEVLGSSLLQFGFSVLVLGAALAASPLRAGIGLGGVAMVALLLGVASTVVAAKGLEERGEVEAFHGRVAIGILVIEDFILIGVLAFTGLGAPSRWAALLLLVPLMRPLLLRLLAAVRHEELALLYGVLLALGGATLFHALGLSEELGAFVAGALLSGSRHTDEIAERMWSLREGFLVAFFLQIGLAGLPDATGWLLAAALLLYLPARVAVFFALLTRFGLRVRTAFFASASLASYSEFAIITGAAAARAGIIPDSLVVGLAMTVALSFAVGTPFHRHAPALYRRFRPLLARFERDVRHPDAQPETLGSARHLVVGMGRTGVAAYDFLAARGRRVVGLDRDPARLERQRAAGRRVAYGVAGDEELWEDLDLVRLDAVILTVPDLDTRIRATRELRTRGFQGVISTTRDSEAEQRLLEAAGADSVCHPLTEAGERLAARSITPALPALLSNEAAGAALAATASASPMHPAADAAGTRNPQLSATTMIRLTDRQLASANCVHTDQTRTVQPASPGCEECLAAGSTWVHLRICMSCGHVGCCDSSPNRHASRHFHASGHPIVRSLEPGEAWAWCYTDGKLL